MSIRAFTLGYPSSYEVAVRIAGNGKAPGGYAFRTREAAETYARSYPEAQKYAPYEIVLPDTFERCTSRNRRLIDKARHEWHEIPYMKQCGICNPILREPMDCELLLVSAPFINPDTGEVA